MCQSKSEKKNDFENYVSALTKASYFNLIEASQSMHYMSEDAYYARRILQQTLRGQRK